MKEGYESGRFMTLKDAHLGAALLVQLAGIEGRGALVSGRRLGTDPEEVAVAVATQHAVVGRLALEVATGDRDAVLPADDVRVAAVELPQRGRLLQRHQLVVDDVPHFDAPRRHLSITSHSHSSILSRCSGERGGGNNFPHPMGKYSLKMLQIPLKILRNLDNCMWKFP